MFSYYPNTNGNGFFQVNNTTGVRVWVSALPAGAEPCSNLIDTLVQCFDNGTTVREVITHVFDDLTKVYTEADGVTLISDVDIAAGTFVACTPTDTERREVCFDNGTTTRRIVQETIHAANGNSYVYYEVDGVTLIAQAVIDAGAVVECEALESDFAQETLCVTVDGGARQFAIKRTERAADGSYTVEYFTFDGATLLTGVIVEVACNDDRELIPVCFRVVTANTGYAVGDILNVSFVYEIVGDQSNSEVAQIIINTTQGTTLTSYNAADLEPCEDFGTEQISGVYYSDSADAYYTGVYTYNEDGTFAGITYYDDAGNVVTPTDAVLVGARDYEDIETCLTATADGVGFVTGDNIKKVDFVDVFDTTGSPIVTTVYFNVSQGGLVIAAPVAGSFELCQPEVAPAIFRECLCDHVELQPVVQFTRTFTVDVDGTETTLTTTLADGTAYTPVGIIAKCGVVGDQCFVEVI